jgi:hypothetical protein
MSLTDFNAKINKSKIDKYQINNNNKTNTKHEFNVKYERYKQDISKDRKLYLGKKIVISEPLLFCRPPSSKTTKE